MYDSLYKFYDAFISSAPDKEWVEYVSRIIGDAPKSGMDVGCGSGRLTLPLAERGYSVVGSDISRQMLLIATEKVKKSRQNIDFVLCSAERIESPHSLDFVTALCDVVNYMKNPKRFFAAAYKALKTGGVLTFDISSRYKLTRILGNNCFTDEKDGVFYAWENILLRDRVQMKLDFFEVGPDGRYTRYTDESEQFIHDADKLEAMLKEVGFSEVKTYSFLRFCKPKGEDERLQIVARK